MKINKLNYEVFALEYLEGTLSSVEMEAMEQFLLKHPAIKAELEEMKDFVVLTPEPIVFDNKKQLLKTPTKNKVVWMSPWRWSVAASMLLLVLAFLFFDSEVTTDSIATIPIKEHTLENAPNTPVINSQKNITKEVTKDTDEVIVANVVKPAEELITKQTVQQRLKKDIETTSKKRERIANYVAPKQAIENVTVTVENQQLASQQTNNHLIEPSIPQREKINVELLETKSIALLETQRTIYTTAINFKPTTNKLIANAETPKKRTLKSLIGKLPGNGVKISIIPSFFTD